MHARRFLDTNVIVYAFSSGDPRSTRAEEVLAAGGTIGVQVLNEFTHVAHRKLKWNWDAIGKALEVIEELVGPAEPLTSATHARAMAIARQHALHFYDALIVAAAQACGCRILCSEDFQHGRRFGELVIENPFRELTGARRN